MKKCRYSDFEKYNRRNHSLYCKYFLEPIARLVALPIINYTNIKPYSITLIGLLISVVAAVLFYKQYFLWAAVLFQLGVVSDFVDGYVARIKRSGSTFGILLDAYVDVVRVVINVCALALAFRSRLDVVFLLMIFSFVHFGESFIDNEFFSLYRFLSKKDRISLNNVDRFFLSIKEKMEKVGLKVILFHYHERLFCVLFLGPVFNKVGLFTIVGILLGCLSIHIKLFLDTALIKNKLINNADEYLRFTTGIKSELADEKQ